jgi:hypothetical protein
MNGKTMLYMDQFGGTVIADTVKDLCEKSGYSKARRMYCDCEDGSTEHIGYVVGPHWYRAFVPFSGKA